MNLYVTEAAGAITGSADLDGHKDYLYQKTNVLYACKSISTMRAAVSANPTVAITFDEASFLNADIMQIFASTPVSAEVAALTTSPTSAPPSVYFRPVDPCFKFFFNPEFVSPIPSTRVSVSTRALFPPNALLRHPKRWVQTAHWVETMLELKQSLGRNRAWVETGLGLKQDLGPSRAWVKQG